MKTGLRYGAVRRETSRPKAAWLVIAIIAIAGIISFSGLASYTTRTSSSSSSSSILAIPPSNTSSTMPAAPTAQPSTGVIIPLFTNDTNQRIGEVSEIVQIKLSHPTVPMMVVVNIEGGAGKNYSSGVATEIKNMQAAGVTVIGYVPTGWGERNVSAVEAAMLTFHDWYAVNGIYLDQMPNWNYNAPNGSWYYPGPDGEFIPAYFATLTHYGKSLGMTKIVANAGADVPKDFIGSVDAIGTFENPYLPILSLKAGWYSIGGLGGWHTEYDKSNFMFFSYNDSTLDPQFVLGAARYVGYMYITNGTAADDRYSILSPYLDQLVSLLASTATDQPATPGGFTAVVQAYVTFSSSLTPLASDVYSAPLSPSLREPIQPPL
jgi:hypothetical protein